MKNIQLTDGQKRLLKRMPNWQRHHWNRAGCPTGPAQFKRFLTLQKRRDGRGPV